MRHRFAVILVVFAASASLLASEPSRLAKGIWLIPGSFIEGTQPDGNSVILQAPGGLIVVDTGRHAEHTAAVLDFAESMSETPAAVINTHWHLDHVGGNILFRKRIPNIRIYASAAIRDALSGFLADYHKQLERLISERSGKPEQQQQYRDEIALIDAGPKLLPDEVIERSGPRVIAGRMLDIHLESHAVTAGDVWIYDPSSRILIAGDLVTLPVPLLDTACPDRWKDALERLGKRRFRTLIPGHGLPMNRERFERYRHSYEALLACAESKEESGRCGDQWLRDVGDLVPDSEHAFTRRLLDYYIDQQLRADPATIAARCSGS